MPERDPTETDPKFNISLPRIPDAREAEEQEMHDPERRDGSERRGTGNPYKGHKVVAVPMMWALTFIASVLTGVFWMGYNWASALRELEDLHRSVHDLQTTMQAGTEHRSSLDSQMAVLQKQLEWEHDRVGRLESRLIRDR
jgi:hypothetical protein